MPKILYFSATWCGPCRTTGLVLKELKKDFPELEVKKFDVDRNYEEAAQWKIKSVPTLICLKNSKEISRVVGARSKEDLIRELELSVNL